jgi:hypothetical protein
MAETPDVGRSLGGIFDTIEKAAQFRFFLLLSVFILTADSLSCIFFQANLLDIPNVIPKTGSMFALFILFLLIFSCFHAIVFPLFRKLTIFLIIAPIYFKYFFKSDSEDRNSDFSYVSLVERDAIKEKDFFTLQRVSQFNDEQKQLENSRNFGFSLGIVLFYNYFCLGGEKYQSLSQLSFQYCDQGGFKFILLPIQIVSLIFAISVIIAFIASLNPKYNDKIRYFK